MNRRRGSVRVKVRTRRVSALGAAALLWAALPASAEPVTLRWRYPEPSRVAGFRAQLGSAPGRVERTIDLGRPMPDPDGTYRAEVELPDGAPSYVSVVAYDAAGTESPRSNEWHRPPRGPVLGTPGRPEVVEP